MVGVGALAGCRSDLGTAGYRREITAAYRWRTLTCDLPAEVRIPAIVSAADAELRRRGYAVDRAAVTLDEGRLTGQRYDNDRLERVVVNVQPLRNGEHRVQITIEPLGNQAQSRAILDGMLAQLGV